MVMEKTPYVMMAGEGAMSFAKEMGMEILPKGSLVTEDALKALEVYKQTGGAFYEVGETEVSIISDSTEEKTVKSMRTQQNKKKMIQ